MVSTRHIAAPSRRIPLSVTVLLTALALAARLASPVPARAAGALSITTPYPAIQAAAGSRVTLDLTVTTSAEARVNPAISGVPTGWSASLHGGGFLIDSVLSSPKSPPAVTLQVNLPDDAKAGTYHLVVKATSGGQTADLPIDIRVAESTGAGEFSLTTDIPRLKGAATTGASFSFSLTLHNDSPADATYTVQTNGPDGWTINAEVAGQSQAATATVTAGSTSSITVTANPPDGTAANTYPIQVAATVNGQPVVQQLEVDITGTYHLTLTTPDSRLSTRGTSSSATQQQFVVQNTGTADLTGVKVTATAPTNWKVTFDKDTVDVKAGEQATVTASIVPSGDAIAGDYVITFTAASSQASQATATADLRFTVETSTLWAIVGIAVIVLTLLALGWVFRTYGRR